MALAQNGDAVQDTSLFDADPRERIFADEAMAIPDATVVHNDAVRTQLNKLFKRKAPASLENAVPYLSFYAFNSRNEPLQRQWNLQVERHSDNADENSQNITGNASGQYVWNYTIADSHTAFNRYKGALNTVDNAAAPHIFVPELDVHNVNPYADKAGPYPAYGKDVHIVDAGNGIDTLLEDQFGVNSEGFGYLWTGDLAQATVDAEDAPIGTGRRVKNLGTGALRGKWCAEYDEGNGVLVDASRQALQDVAGRPLDVDENGSNDYWNGRMGSWNVTTEQVEIALSNLTNPNRLQSAKAYAAAFQEHGAPSDPVILSWMWGYADTTSQRGLFTFSSEDAYGYSGGDVGNYGALSQQIQFIVVDPDLNFFVTSDKITTYPGDTVTITATMIRLLPSNDHVSVTPDGPLHIKILSGDGTVVADGPMVAGAGDQWEYEFTITEDESYSGLVTGFKDGSRPPDSGDISIFGGAQNPSIDLVVDVINKSNAGSHIVPNTQFSIVTYAANDETEQLVTLDVAPAPEVALTRADSAGGVQTYDGAAWVQVTGPQNVVFLPMTLVGDYYESATLTQPDGDERDIVANVRAHIDGVLYFGELFREVTGSLNKHDEVDKRLVGFVGDFTLQGRHWIPGDLFTATTLALFNDAGAIASTPLISNVVSYAITAVDQGARTLTIAGDQTADLPVGRVIDIAGSTGNDGSYKVESATENLGNTDIVVVQTIPDATADGSIDNDTLQPSLILITADNRSLQLDDTFALGPLIAHGLPAGSYTWLSSATATWPKIPVFLFFAASIADNVGNTIGLEGSEKFDIVDSKNAHDKYAFDGPGFVGFPTR